MSLFPHRIAEKQIDAVERLAQPLPIDLGRGSTRAELDEQRLIIHALRGPLRSVRADQDVPIAPRKPREEAECDGGDNADKHRQLAEPALQRKHLVDEQDEEPGDDRSDRRAKRLPPFCSGWSNFRFNQGFDDGRAKDLCDKVIAVREFDFRISTDLAQALQMFGLLRRLVREGP